MYGSVVNDKNYILERYLSSNKNLPTKQLYPDKKIKENANKKASVVNAESDLLNVVKKFTSSSGDDISIGDLCSKKSSRASRLTNKSISESIEAIDDAIKTADAAISSTKISTAIGLAKKSSGTKKNQQNLSLSNETELNITYGPVVQEESGWDEKNDRSKDSDSLQRDSDSISIGTMTSEQNAKELAPIDTSKSLDHDESVERILKLVEIEPKPSYSLILKKDFEEKVIYETNYDTNRSWEPPSSNSESYSYFEFFILVFMMALVTGLRSSCHFFEEVKKYFEKYLYYGWKNTTSIFLRQEKDINVFFLFSLFIPFFAILVITYFAICILYYSNKILLSRTPNYLTNYLAVIDEN